MLASQAVPELMHGNDEQSNEQSHWKDPPLKEAGNVLNYVSQLAKATQTALRIVTADKSRNCGVKKNWILPIK